MADYIYINDTGVIVPDTAAVQTQVIAEYKATFGTDLNTDPQTPQGALIVMETLARIAVLQNNAQMANQINPNLAGGVLLDAILQLTGTQRIATNYSLVTANLTGVPGTIVASGSQAQETVNMQIFQLTIAVTLDGFGNGVGVFQALNPGPIAVATNTLTVIIAGVVGWETVTNPAPATLGTLTQSDVSARNLRRAALGLQGSSLAGAIIGALTITPGVTSLSFLENVANTTQTIEGIVMVAHSIYACVNGGTDIDVANALVSKKSGGCAYNGGTSVIVTVPFSGQPMTVLFDRPTPIQIIIQITVVPPPTIQDPTDAVKQAILDYAAGNINGYGSLGVGDNVSAFELGAAVAAEIPGIYVKSLQISIPSPLNLNCSEITIGLNEIALILVTNISVIVL